MWELDCKESWAPKNWCFLTLVLEKTLECPLDCKEIKQVHPKGNQSWIFIGRTGAEVEIAILWPPDQRTDSCEKTLMLGKTEGGRRRGWQRMRWLDGITNSMAWVWVNSRSWWWTGKPGVLQSMGWQRIGLNWVIERLNWTELNCSDVTGSLGRAASWEKWSRSKSSNLASFGYKWPKSKFCIIMSCN